MKLKSKVYLDESAYIDFEDNVYYYVDYKTGKMVCNELTSKGIRILRCLCEHYAEEWVSLTEIFEFVKKRELQVKEYKYQKGRDDRERRNLGKYISKLSNEKIIKSKEGITTSYLIIDESRNSQYKLEFFASPFEMEEDVEYQSNKEENFNYNSVSALEFFKERLSTPSPYIIKRIDMSFFGGSEWLRNDSRLRLMDDLRDINMEECRIIINNSSEITDIMQKNMGHPDRPYISIIENIRNWYEYQKKYSLFKIKVCPIPLLHCYYHIKAEETKKSVMRLHFYTYKNAYIRENYAQIFNSTSSYYHLYEEEFSYLWEISEDIEKYLSKFS